MSGSVTVREKLSLKIAPHQPRYALGDASHTNISLFFIENKPLTASHPFSPSYNGAAMMLSSIQTPASHASPPPPFGWPNQGIPNEAIFPPNPNQIQPLTTSQHEPVSHPGKPGDRPAPRRPPRGAKGAPWGGALWAQVSPQTCAFPPLAGIVEEVTPRAMQSPVLSREEELYWLALKLVPGLGSITSGKLVDRFRTPQAIFRASRTELEGAGISGAIAQSIASGCTFEDRSEEHT